MMGAEGYIGREEKGTEAGIWGNEGPGSEKGRDRCEDGWMDGWIMPFGSSGWRGGGGGASMYTDVHIPAPLPPKKLGWDPSPT